jgi:hypothetical protein
MSKTTVVGIVLLIAFVYLLGIFFGRFPSPFPEPAPTPPRSVSEVERACLKLVIFYDASEQTDVEQTAVGIAALNRAKFQKTDVCSVFQRFLTIRPLDAWTLNWLLRQVWVGENYAGWSDANVMRIQKADYIAAQILSAVSDPSADLAALLPDEYRYLGGAIGYVRVKRPRGVSQKAINAFIAETRSCGQSPGPIDFRCLK